MPGPRRPSTTRLPGAVSGPRRPLLSQQGDAAESCWATVPTVVGTASLMGSASEEIQSLFPPRCCRPGLGPTFGSHSLTGSTEQLFLLGGILNNNVLYTESPLPPVTTAPQQVSSLNPRGHVPTPLCLGKHGRRSNFSEVVAAEGAGFTWGGSAAVLPSGEKEAAGPDTFLEGHPRSGDRRTSHSPGGTRGNQRLQVWAPKRGHTCPGCERAPLTARLEDPDPRRTAGQAPHKDLCQPPWQRGPSAVTVAGSH